MQPSSLFSQCQCSIGKPVEFDEGQTMLTIGDGNGRVGLLMEGEAHVSMIDANGTETLIEVLGIGDSFGEYLMMPVVEQYYSVVADSKCVVSFINYKNVLYNCKAECANHSDLVKTLLLLTSRRAQELSFHVNVLSQKSTREKILLYLSFQSMQFGSDEFTIPFALSKLASYLAVDRSAMMREIKKLNDEGYIISSNRSFHILKR